MTTEKKTNEFIIFGGCENKFLHCLKLQKKQGTLKRCKFFLNCGLIFSMNCDIINICVGKTHINLTSERCELSALDIDLSWINKRKIKAYVKRSFGVEFSRQSICTMKIIIVSSVSHFTRWVAKYCLAIAKKRRSKMHCVLQI